MVVSLEKIPRNSAFWSNFRLLAVIAVATWWTISVQNTLRTLREEIRQMRPIVYQKHGFAKEFIFAYQNSKIADKELRKLYTFSKSEALMLSSYSQDDDRVIDHIRNNLLIPPPVTPTKQPDYDTSRGLATKVHNTLLSMNLTKGFYIESGAFDGYFMSNTLYLETWFKWTGLLIEPDPPHFTLLKKRGRNAWLLPTCLSLENRTTLVRFLSQSTNPKVNSSSGNIELNCMPLYSVIKALPSNISSIGLVSLDIGGDEMNVLSTVALDKLDIKMFAVKFKNIKGGKNELLTMMSKKGYTEVFLTPEENRQTNNWKEEIVLLKKTDKKTT
ncbi:Hypothetical predicted protein [Cloeon dipterum]|uniref:Methyltransferase FkbM domain-containing protein n=1 Tax=Cloeon dipterum TaxID=197152 RepID=A0A8S1CUS4_9INSE|nr:Hypothetical predicted protein [Cloeon dipterum]